MATTVDHEHDQHYVEFDEYIDFQLHKTRSNIKWTDIATALVGTGVLFLTYLLFFVLLDHWVIDGGFSPLARGMMLGLLLLAVAAWLGWRVVLPYLRQVNTLFAARTIERSEPALKSSLLNLVDLREAGREVPAEIKSALEKRAAVTLAHMDVEHSVDRRPLMLSSYALLAVVVLCCLYALLSPKKISNSLWRAVLPVADVDVSTQTEIIAVQPGDTEVPAGTRLDVAVELRGKVPPEVTLFYTTADRKFVDERLALREDPDKSDTYRGVLAGENGRGILQETTYRIAAGDAQSDEFQITVVQPPSAKINELRFEYPAYMELEPKTNNTGHIDEWEGASVTLSAQTNVPVVSAVLQFADEPDAASKAEELPLRITNGTQLQADWKLAFRSDGTFPRHYRILCKNERGDSDPSPTLYNVNIRRDQPPEITLVDPAGDLEMPANGVVPLVVQARDPDFKLSYITLRAQRDEAPLANEMIYEGHEQEFGSTYDFRLEPLRLKAGDVITFWLEARDNKQPVGNRKNTPQISIRITEPVSEKEVEQQLAQEKQRQQEALEPPADAEPMPPEQAENPEQQAEGQGAEAAGEQQPGEQGEQGQGQGEEGAGEETGAEQGQPNGQSGTSQERLDPENPDDTGQALEKIYRRMQAEQQQGEQQEQGATDPGDQSGEAGENGQQPERKPQDEQSDNATGESSSKKSQRDGKSPAGGQPEPGQSGDQQDPMDQEQAKPDAQERGGEQGGQSSSEPQGEQGESAEERGQTGENSATRPAEQDGKPGARRASEDANGEPQPGENDGDENGSKQADKPLEGPELPKQNSDEGDGRPGASDQAGDSSPSQASDKQPNDASGQESDDSSNNSSGGQQSPAPGEKPKEQPGSQKKSNVDQPDTARPADDPAQEPLPGKTPPQGVGRPDDKPASEDQAEDSRIKPDKPTDPSGEPGDGESASESDGSASDQEGQQAGDNEGQQGQQPGNEQQSGDKKQQGNSKGGGEKSAGKQPSESSGGEAGESGDGEGQTGEAGKQPNGNPQTKQGSGKQPGQGAQQAGGGQAGGAQQQSSSAGTGEGGDAAGPGADEANLEYAKEAADLVLKRLQNELERGEVDQKLLDELGWTEDDMRKFADRLQNQLTSEQPAETPESLARRRQFEEMLKTLDLRSTYERRAESGTKSTQSDLIGPRRSPVPAEYRDEFEAFTRSRAKRANNAQR
jgi:hypothetical protein